MNKQVIFLLGAMLGVVLVVGGYWTYTLIRPWFRTLAAGEAIPFPQIVALRLRGNPPDLLVDAYITLKKLGVQVTMPSVEATYVAKRNSIHEAYDLVQEMQSEDAAGKG